MCHAFLRWSIAKAMSITVATLQTSHARVAHVAHMTLAARAFTLGGRCMQVLFQHASWTMSDAAFYNSCNIISIHCKVVANQSNAAPRRNTACGCGALGWDPLGVPAQRPPLVIPGDHRLHSPRSRVHCARATPETQAQAQVQAERGTGGGRGIGHRQRHRHRRRRPQPFCRPSSHPNV